MESRRNGPQCLRVMMMMMVNMQGKERRVAPTMSSKSRCLSFWLAAIAANLAKMLKGHPFWNSGTDNETPRKSSSVGNERGCLPSQVNGCLDLSLAPQRRPGQSPSL